MLTAAISLVLIPLLGHYIRIATKTKWPPHWIPYTSIAYISAKMWSSVLRKAYLWSTNDGSTSWTVNKRQAPRQGTKLESLKITCNEQYCSLSYWENTF